MNKTREKYPNPRRWPATVCAKPETLERHDREATAAIDQQCAERETRNRNRDRILAGMAVLAGMATLLEIGRVLKVWVSPGG